MKIRLESNSIYYINNLSIYYHSNNNRRKEEVVRMAQGKRGNGGTAPPKSECQLVIVCEAYLYGRGRGSGRESLPLQCPPPLCRQYGQSVIHVVVLHIVLTIL